MKKVLFIAILLLVILFSVNANGFYFDVGLGFGRVATKFDGIDISKTIGNVTEIGLDFGLKAGFGPLGNIPIYPIATMGGIAHRLSDSFDYLQFNTYIAAAGLIFYPFRILQIAGSFGYSFASNQTSLPMTMFKSTSGYAGDVSIAFDLGRKNHGFLIGLRYFGAKNLLSVSYVEQSTSAITIFTRYAFRHK